MSLDKLRRKVDRIDDQIVMLLNQRAQACRCIGSVKLKKGHDIYAPHREKEVLDRLAAKNKGPITEEALRAIYREIMSFSISLEKKISIAYLGPAATYTHQAAQKKFGSSVEYTSCASISEIFSEVEKSRADYGVVPVENSTEGAVNHTLDMFMDSNLKIYGEVYLPIHHHLLSIGNPISSITKVYSINQVLAQCRTWIETHLRGADLVETASTSEAAQIVANNSNREGIACIASQMAAQLYSLKILASSIENQPDNMTRFLVISRTPAKSTADDKTSLLMEIKDRSGALHDILVPFKKAKINLTMIESRPSKKKAWSYYFFVDFEGHHQEPRIQKTLRSLERHCALLKVLGSYPKAQP